MHDGNDEQLLCLLTFKYLDFILEFFQELPKLNLLCMGSIKLKSRYKKGKI